MKTTTRIIALVTVLLLCLSFSGCKALDEMRACQGFWNEDGSISLGDTRYLPLPKCELLSPSDYSETTIYVTDKDVPVLISPYLGGFSLTEDGVLLRNDTLRYMEKPAYYCREDRYEALLKQIQDGPTLDRFCYWYYDYEQNETIQYLLTLEQADTVNLVLDTAIPHTVYSLDWEYRVTLIACSEDLYFCDGEYELLYLKNQYYFIVNANQTNQEPLVCDVPTEYNSLFAEILNKSLASQQMWQENGDNYIAL